jgi:hypothetical protein
MTKENKKLNLSNFSLYAAQHYTNPRVLNVDEFYEDLNKFKYVKKLFTKYKTSGELKERLILNHIISIYNVFNIEAANKMCFFKVDEESHSALKTFLLYLNYIQKHEFINISCDLYVVKKLNKI